MPTPIVPAAPETILQTLENPFIQLWNDIKAEAAKVLPQIESLAVSVEQGAVATLEQVFEIGVPLAVNAIVAQIPNAVSGEEKFGNAVASVAQDLQTTLGPLAIGDVQTLVQSAFTGLTKIASAL